MSESSTRDKILTTAEDLFAERGIDATSLRDITSHAGVNLAAVNYHFRTKGDLVWAVYERRMGPVSATRVMMLEQLEERHEPPTLEEILDAFYRPVLSVAYLPDGSLARFMPLMGRMYLEKPDLKMRMFEQFIRPMANRYIDAFARCLPHLERAEILMRMQFAVGALLHTLMGHQLVEQFLDREGRGSVDTILGRLITFAAAGMRAPAFSKDSVHA